MKLAGVKCRSLRYRCGYEIEMLASQLAPSGQRSRTAWHAHGSAYVDFPVWPGFADRAKMGRMGEHDDDPIDVARVFEKFRQGVREHVAADDIVTHFDLGVAYFEMGMLDDAEEDFALVLKVDPTHAAAWAKLELIMRLTNPEGGGPIGRA